MRFRLAVLASFVVACTPDPTACPAGFVCTPADGGGVDGSTSDGGRDVGTDAFVARDAFVAPDAYVAPDAFVAPDAYVGPDACAWGTWYLDADHDGYGAAAAQQSACSQPAGTVTDATDCDDTAAARHPGAIELCNTIDDDCDGVVDEGVVLTWFYDGDADGHGSPSDHLLACTMPPHYVASSDDCDDAHASVHPGATEICDGLRNDCTAAAPDAELLHTYYVDCDRDGFAASSTALVTCQAVGGPPSCSGGQYISLRPTDASNTDCNDLSATQRPDTQWYADCDGDFFLAVGARSTTSCTAPTTNACVSGTAALPHGQWVAVPNAGNDCWDFNASVYPGEPTAFATPYATGTGSSFDWDCDGIATDPVPVASGCTRVITTGACNPATPTWLSAVPPCGASGTQFTCGGVGCTATTTTAVAACR